MAITSGQNQLQGNKTTNTKVAIKPWPWADTFPIAELSFKRLNEDIVVLNGGDPTTLAFSAGAIAPFNQTNSDQPFVVAGHRDSHFAFLEDILMKDVISMTDQHGQSQLYQVEAIDIVDASSGQLPVLANDSSLILITCYPFNAIGNDANERYVITAKLL
jgi:sortase A